jgi:TusA-related sulfurtransferase/uncharacterized OsmC-like protein
MNSGKDLNALQPDHIFDGGDLDCGSGLVLLIREHMQKVPVGGILEMRSEEPTVCDDLPPWCRMVGHEYLGLLGTKEQARYFIRKNELKEEDQNLENDKKRAQEYEWRIRTRSTGPQQSTVYCRNFSFHVGQAASFEEKDKNPSALEYLAGALSASLSTAYATNCAKAGLKIDDVEITLRCKLENILAHLDLEEGNPGISNIDVKCFVTSMEDPSTLQGLWMETLERAPLFATLKKAVPINVKFNVV